MVPKFGACAHTHAYTQIHMEVRTHTHTHERTHNKSKLLYEHTRLAASNCKDHTIIVNQKNCSQAAMATKQVCFAQ